MKKIIVAIVLFLGLQTHMNAQFTVGGGATYISPGSSIGLQIKGLLGINEKLDLSPSVSYILTDGNPVIFDFDLHYALLEINDGLRFMPFAGLSLLTGVGDTALAINLGGSIRFEINENTIYIEPKYRIIDSAGFVVSAGMLF